MQPLREDNFNEKSIKSPQPFLSAAVTLIISDNILFLDMESVVCLALFPELTDMVEYFVGNIGISVLVDGKELISGNCGIGAGVVVAVGIAFFFIAEIRDLNGDISVED